MMKGGLGGLMKQAQQMQKNMQKAQAELATVEVEGQAMHFRVTARTAFPMCLNWLENMA